MNEVISSKGLRFGLTSEVAQRVDDAGLLDLVEYCHFLYEQAFHANTELEIYRAMMKAPSQFESDVICAPCFFGVVRMCLVESIFMNCARLYDSSGEISLGTLIELAGKRAESIDVRARALGSGRLSFDADKPIAHALAADEERFYQEQTSEQRKWDDVLSEVGRRDSENVLEGTKRQTCRSTVVASVTAAELIDLWTKRLNGLSKLSDNLREQRNKVFAHNGIESLGYEDLIEKSPLKFGDVQRLVDLALDVTIGLVEITSGVLWPRKPVNANDIEGLLSYVDMGMKSLEG